MTAVARGVHLVVQDTGGCRVVPLDHDDPVTLGKLASNAVALDAVGVSRRHAVVFRHAGSYHVRDLESSNGVVVDDRRVDGDARLTDGAVVMLGEARLVFRGRRTAEVPVPIALQSGAGVEGVKARLHQQLVERSSAGQLPSDRGALQALTSSLLTDACAGLALPQGVDGPELARAVVDEVVGLGPLQRLLDQPRVREIMVNDPETIYIETTDGRLRRVKAQFRDEAHLLAVIGRVAGRVGREVNERRPLLDARLPDGGRLNAVVRPLAVHGPAITIRKAPLQRPGVRELVEMGTLSRKLAKYLIRQVRERRSICISGGTSSGKTTLLAALARMVPRRQRIVTIEDVNEIVLPRRHVVSLESRPAGADGVPAVPIRHLVANALRMRPDRIVVGECRGGEALDMLQAMNTGHAGSMTTLHANSVREGLARLETLVLQADSGLPLEAIQRQIGFGLDLWVHLERRKGGVRAVREVARIGWRNRLRATRVYPRRKAK